MKWEPHYTGIETYSQDFCFGLINLYLSRNRNTKRMHLARISSAWRYRPWRPSFHLGVFPNSTNFGNRERFPKGGWEAFSRNLHLGWHPRAQWGVTWSGSMVKPHSTYTIHLGKLFFGSRAEEWLQRLMCKRDQRRWEREQLAYEQAFDIDLDVDQDIPQ